MITSSHIIAIFGVDDAVFWSYVGTVAFYAAVSYVVGQAVAALTSTPKGGKTKPRDIEMPTVEEGVVYPVVFGTPKRIEGYAIAWWGDTSNAPIIEKHSQWTLFGTKTTKTTVAWKYFVGMHLKLCHSNIDGIKQIWVGDSMAWPDSSGASGPASDVTALAEDGQTSLSINKPTFFGAVKQEGGLAGTIDIQYGSGSQIPNDYIVSKTSADVSASRGVVSVILRSFYIGNSSYLKQFGFLCKRTQKLDDGSPQWYIAKADIGGDLNPVHILRECYTNTRWGLKHSVELFDETIWQDAADVLYAEGFGLSPLWGGNQDITDFIGGILSYIDAVVYISPETGKFVIKLVRNDYDVADLETYDESDLISVDGYARPTLGAVPNAFTVRYTDIINNKDVSVPDHDMALQALQGGKIIVRDLDYPYVTKPELAAKLVARARNATTSLLAAMTITGKRSLANKRPGDVFIINWAILGIEQMVVRVVEVNLGSLQDGTVTLICGEDVFATQSSLYAAPPATGWVPPSTEPQEVSYSVLIETPFYALMKFMGMSSVVALSASASYLLVGAAKPSADSFDYELLLRATGSGDFSSEGDGYFTPTALLAESVPMDAVTVEISLSDAVDLDHVFVGQVALIENEFVCVTDINVVTNKVTVARGVLDTLPAYHDDSGGCRIWFLEASAFLTSLEFTTSDIPDIKILSRTPLGSLDESEATIIDAPAFDSRQARPYPPGNFKIDGVSYPATFTGQPNLTWSHRNRATQNTVVLHSAASVTIETGTTYTLRIYDEDSALIRTETSITAALYNYSEADERADCGLGPTDPLNTSLRFELESIRDGLTSWQHYDITVARV